MGVKDTSYEVVHAGTQLNPHRYRAGGWAMFQRARADGGRWWLGRTYDDCFWLEFDRPVMLADAIGYVIDYDRVALNHDEFIDNFELT